jgi:hypothetical protein
LPRRSAAAIRTATMLARIVGELSAEFRLGAGAVRYLPGEG